MSSSENYDNIFEHYADQLLIQHDLEKNNGVILDCDSPLSANDFIAFRDFLKKVDVTIEGGNKIVLETPIFFFNLKNKSTNHYCFISIYNEEELVLLSGKEDIEFASANDAEDYINILNSLTPKTEEERKAIAEARKSAMQQIESLNSGINSSADVFRKRLRRQVPTDLNTSGENVIDNDTKPFGYFDGQGIR